MYSKVNIQAFKIALLEKGYSYNEFSRKTGISTVTIMRMIQGKNKTNPKNAKKIADALDKPVTELFNIEWCGEFFY